VQLSTSYCSSINLVKNILAQPIVQPEKTKPLCLTSHASGASVASGPAYLSNQRVICLVSRISQIHRITIFCTPAQGQLVWMGGLGGGVNIVSVLEILRATHCMYSNIKQFQIWNYYNAMLNIHICLSNDNHGIVWSENDHFVTTDTGRHARRKTRKLDHKRSVNFAEQFKSHTF
jgi:hypothetical protein